MPVGLTSLVTGTLGDLKAPRQMLQVSHCVVEAMLLIVELFHPMSSAMSHIDKFP